MDSEETPTPQPFSSSVSQRDDALSGEEVRRATFPQALRGYDREAVHDLLDRVADWMEGRAAAVSSAAPDMRDELAKVGEKTAGILTAAEEAARNLRDEAAEYAERLRADAEDEARKARLNASQRMDEMVADAEQKAQRIIDDAVARRRQLNLAISSLIDRRDEIAADTTRLAEELLSAVEELRRSDSGREGDSTPAAAAAVPSPEPALEEEATGEEPVDDMLGEETPSDDLLGEEETPVAEEPTSEEETQFHPGPDSEDTQMYEQDDPEARRSPRLLVDPDEES